MNIQTNLSSSDAISISSDLADFMIHYRVPNGRYATDLAAAVYALRDANMELAKLRDLADGTLNQSQKAMRTWAIETVGECNQILLEHFERYPYLFQ